LNKEKYMSSSLSRIFSIIALGCLSGAVQQGAAQTFPSWPTPIYQPSQSIDQGVSAVAAPNSYYGTVLLSVYTNGNRFSYGVSLDGQNYIYGGPTTLPEVGCNAATPSICSATVAVFNGTIYAAYSDYGTYGLDVLIGTPVGTAYTWALTHQDTSVRMTTAPAMAVSPDGSHLIVIYGTSNDSYTKNQFFESTLDAYGNWTQASEAGSLQTLRLSSGSRPAMSVLNNTLFLCSQQNNSHHQLYVYSSLDGVNWSYVEDFSGLALGGGASMVTYQGNLVLANQQNNSNHALFVFSSPNGINWYAQEYPNYRMGGDPGLALFNNGISLVYRANDSSAALYGSFTTN
jgi:hypothetical protein